MDLSSAPKPSGFAALLRPVQRLLERSQGDPFYAVVSHRNFKPTYE